MLSHFGFPLASERKRGAQATKSLKENEFSFRDFVLVRPFSSRSREENQNDLTCSLSLKTRYHHGYSREAQGKFFAELFFKKATSLVRSLSPTNQNLNKWGTIQKEKLEYRAFSCFMDS